MPDTRLSIGVIDPEAIGTHGDNGNAIVLRQRARWRGLEPIIHPIHVSDPIPSSLDIYVMGGGTVDARPLLLEHLTRARGLQRALRRGRPLLAIGSSMQILGRYYIDEHGKKIGGLEIMDITTDLLAQPVIREVAVRPMLAGLTELLTGHEHHMSATRLGEGVEPLGQMIYGTGNGYALRDPKDRKSQYLDPHESVFVRPQQVDPPVVYEGATMDAIIGTYMHGPVLARNPQLADYMLQLATGKEKMEDIYLPSIYRMRRERLNALGISAQAEK
ncbi:MAG: glutamine amidotransferase [Actinomycetaceae bacterium]|nr:glutamine amidotransferase [Actinomycetaceae bacterium]